MIMLYLSPKLFIRSASTLSGK